MFCGAQFPDHAAACAVHIPAIISIGPSPLGPDHDALIARRMGRMPPEASVARDDPAWFFYTSGTTGHPKAAVLTHGQMAFVVTNHLCDLMPGTTEQDASPVVAPLSVPPRSDAPTVARWPARAPCAPASESESRSHDRRADADPYTGPRPWRLVGAQFAIGVPLPGPATEILILGQDRTSLHVASVGAALFAKACCHDKS